jgi:TRAP-type uncharacterized transport system fused permease subunit
MATIPTLLYYFALFLIVEIDARKFGMPNVVIDKHATIGMLTRNYWFHFLSLVAIIFFMVIGFSPAVSVFWATMVAFISSFLHVDCALIPCDVLRGRKPLGRGLWNSGLVKALEAGSVGMLSVGATCAAAGIIVDVVTLTGLGLKFSSIVLQYAVSGTRLIMAMLNGSASSKLRACCTTSELLTDHDVADRVDRGPRRAGHCELHHLRGDRRAGAHAARRC